MKIALLAICLALPAALRAQPGDAEAASPVIHARETFIGLSVTDLDASIRAATTSPRTS